MRFYTQQHNFCCGIDLHARTMDPLNLESGRRDRSSVVLHMSTLHAVRHNPVLKAFYAHLRAVDKAPKVALTACMRKLLVILNATLKHRTPWQHNYAHSS